MKINWQFLGLVLWLVALSVLVTIYLAWLLFPWEISWLQLKEATYLSAKTIIANFNHLMVYLTQSWVNRLAMPDFPSSASGLSHFKDVKLLFQLVTALVLIGILPSLFWLRREIIAGTLFLYRKLFSQLAIFPLALALLGSLVGFNRVFIFFHSLVFIGKTNWLFNPYTDPVIKILPETFFLHCFLIFLLIYEVFFWGLTVLSYFQFKQLDKMT
ncbi:TIGR01906 family membrane protein [Streptococcus cuniculipharyngis]|uniref:TIGR01906 family membrane protein n=1 Tax=Streptococcus cuniculipharyngis TaxID=1562651 RepID=A0A5C5SF59_9STRE|nr:TIGR01906 family membrane protein [Streptococcus cuniculipharyngis]TWS98942.1 TIGR01906 family membrane protein [Streptococcus cuniculipharyngis]